jgi:hypothetical protein
MKEVQIQVLDKVPILCCLLDVHDFVIFEM